MKCKVIFLIGKKILRRHKYTRPIQIKNSHYACATKQRLFVSFDFYYAQLGIQLLSKLEVGVDTINLDISSLGRLALKVF